MNHTQPDSDETPIPTRPTQPLIGRVAYALAILAGAFETMSLHSVFSSQPSGASFTGLLVFGAGVLVLAQRPMAPVVRRRLLAGASVTVSVVALLSLALLRTRIAEAQGIVPPLRPFVQSALILAFQTGWALTYWLSAAKNVTAQSRYIPAALGTVILLGGGLLTGGMAGPEETAAPGTVVYEKFATPDDLVAAKEVTRAGGDGGTAYAHYHSGGEPLLGLSFSTRDWFRRERIGSDLLGVFEPDAASGNQYVLQAQPGYVVTAIEVQSDDYINALRVQFAPYDGVLISPFDRYWSDWAGSFQRNQPTTLLTGGNELVVGVRGATGLVLNSLGLLVVDRQP